MNGLVTTRRRGREQLHFTDPDQRSKYSFGMRVASDWTSGSHYEFTGPDGTGIWGEGENLEVEPPRAGSFRASAPSGTTR